MESEACRDTCIIALEFALKWCQKEGWEVNSGPVILTRDGDMHELEVDIA